MSPRNAVAVILREYRTRQAEGPTLPRPMEKKFIDADQMLIDSFRLAVKIHEGQFKPDFLVGIWRGGSGVGIAVQEGLEFFGTETDHIAIRTSYEGPDSYSEQRSNRRRIRVHGLDYILRRVEAHHRLLIVDDVYSTGRSIQAVLRQLTRKARRNRPHDIRIATIWYRPTPETKRAPDYFLHETRDWLVLPHELASLTDEELRQHKPLVADLLDDMNASTRSNLGLTK